jgi:hypothetical protein
VYSGVCQFDADDTSPRRRRNAATATSRPSERAVRIHSGSFEKLSFQIRIHPLK